MKKLLGWVGAHAGVMTAVLLSGVATEPVCISVGGP